MTLIDDDRLAHMLDLQEQLQKRYLGQFPYELINEDRADYIRTMVLATSDELHEALREVAWKPWSKRIVGEYDRENYKAELVDALHFFLNLMLVAGISAEELYVEYLRKNNINHDRINDGYISPTG